MIVLCMCCLSGVIKNNRIKSGNWQTNLIAGRSKNAIKFEDDVTKRRPQRRTVIPALQHQAVPEPARQINNGPECYQNFMWREAVQTYTEILLVSYNAFSEGA